MPHKAPPEKKNTPQTTSQKSGDGTRSFLSLSRPFSPPPAAPPPVNRLHSIAAGTQGLLGGVAVLPGEYIRKEAGRGVRGRGSSLPFLDRIQRSFGQRHNLSSIKAHVGGAAADASSRIGAEAYAMGEHVAFQSAPDLHTAAHEAAHVVQQRSGVRIAGGVGQVGDAYERQADAVAARVILGQSSEALLSTSESPTGAASAIDPSSPPLQMRIKSYNTSGNQDLKREYQSKVENIETRINDAVIGSRRLALNWRTYKNSNGHLGQWYKKAEEFNEDPDIMPRFIHARFGYAIEELTNQTLPSSSDGLAIQRQVTEGGTRPDIVLKDTAKNIEVAWMDITSEDSAEHIFRKSGSGWRNKPFVAEILYDPLQLPEILTGVDDPLLKEVGAYKADRAQVRYDQIKIKRDELTKELLDFEDEISNLNKGDKKKQTQQKLIDLGFDLYRCKVNGTKGALLYCGINYGPYGFSAESTTINPAQQYVEEKAQIDIGKELKDLNVTKLFEIEDRLREISDKEKKNFQSRVEQSTSSDITNFIYEGMALVHALTAKKNIDDIADRLMILDVNDPRFDRVLSSLDAHLDNFPTERDFDSLQQWSSDSYPLLSVAKSYYKVLKKKMKFEEYLKNKHGNDWEFKMKEREDQLYAGLMDWPLDLTVLEEVDEHMETEMDID